MLRIPSNNSKSFKWKPLKSHGSQNKVFFFQKLHCDVKDTLFISIQNKYFKRKWSLCLYIEFDIFINSYRNELSLMLLACTFPPLTVATSGEMSWERTHWLYILPLAPCSMRLLQQVSTPLMLETVQFSCSWDMLQY